MTDVVLNPNDHGPVNMFKSTNLNCSSTEWTIRYFVVVYKSIVGFQITSPIMF